MKFLANENIPLASVKLLQEIYDASSVSQEKRGISDIEVLTWAHDEHRIILTFDRDYGELIYKHKLPIPGGVVYFRFDPQSPSEPFHILQSVIDSKLKLENKYSVIERDKIRQRSL